MKKSTTNGTMPASYCINDAMHERAHRRQDFAASMRLDRARYRQIGATLGVSMGQARNLVKKAKKRASLPAWLNGLDLRTANVLLRAGFQSVEEVREAITTGKTIERVQASRRNQIEAWLQSAQSQ